MFISTIEHCRVPYPILLMFQMVIRWPFLAKLATSPSSSHGRPCLPFRAALSMRDGDDGPQLLERCFKKILPPPPPPYLHTGEASGVILASSFRAGRDRQLLRK